MPHCCEHTESTSSCKDEIKDQDDESSHPSCTLLLFGSTVVAYTIYHTAKWLLREQREWFCRSRRHPPPSSFPTRRHSDAQPSPREEVSKASSCLMKCLQWVQPRRRIGDTQAVQLNANDNARSQRVEPLRLGKPPPQRPRVPWFRRLAQCFGLPIHCCGSCCFHYGSSLGEERDNELHDQSREEVIDEEGGREGEVTIIHFEQKEEEADGQRTAPEEPQQPTTRRRSSSTQSPRAKLQKATADREWEETVDLTFRRVVYSIAGGTIVALTMFRGHTMRWSIIALGAGLGLGSALRDSSYILHR